MIPVASACMVAVVVDAIVWPREREPSFQGKTLSEWLKLYAESVEAIRLEEKEHVFQHAAGTHPVRKREAEEAVGRIGTNALPWMIRKIGYERSDLSWNFETASWTLRGWISRKPFFVSPRHTREDIEAELALYGFYILGPRAGSGRMHCHDARTWNEC